MIVATLRVGKALAELENNGKWSSDSPSLERFLNRFFGPKTIPPSPAAGFSEYANQAREAAQMLQGELVWNESLQDETDEGIVY